MNLAYSNPSDIQANKINVLFIMNSPFQLQIKHNRTPVLMQEDFRIPFDVTPRANRAASVIVSQTAPSSIHTPFVDLMLHPKKLEQALMLAKEENDAFEAALHDSSRSPIEPLVSDQSDIKKMSRTSFAVRQSELIQVEFSLEAPSARSVKLAADFTDWEELALDMVKSQGGVWFTSVPLSPGSYSYRFIVDGKWCDDPHTNQFEPNPFGTANAVVTVS